MGRDITVVRKALMGCILLTLILLPAGAVTLQGGGGFGGQYDLTHDTYQHVVILSGGVLLALNAYWEVGAVLQGKTSYAALINGGPEVLQGEQAGALQLKAGRKLISQNLFHFGAQAGLSFWYALYEHTEQAFFYPEVELGPYLDLRLESHPFSIRAAVPIGFSLRGDGAHRINWRAETSLSIRLGGQR